MTVEEYQTYFDFCYWMYSNPLRYEAVQYANIDKCIKMKRENFNKKDLAYIFCMHDDDILEFADKAYKRHIVEKSMWK